MNRDQLLPIEDLVWQRGLARGAGLTRENQVDRSLKLSDGPPRAIRPVESPQYGYDVLFKAGWLLPVASLAVPWTGRTIGEIHVRHESLVSEHGLVVLVAVIEQQRGLANAKPRLCNNRDRRLFVLG